MTVRSLALRALIWPALWGVDSDQSEMLTSPINLNYHRVTVDYLNDLGLACVGWDLGEGRTYTAAGYKSN
jgi:hypothetical protein